MTDECLEFGGRKKSVKFPNATPAAANKHRISHVIAQKEYIRHKHMVFKLASASTPLCRIIDPAWPHRMAGVRGKTFDALGHIFVIFFGVRALF